MTTAHIETAPRHDYLARFASVARATDAPPGYIGEAIAEIETHVADSGQDPREAFGQPEAYARQLGGPRSPESLGAAVLRLVALAYGAACLGTGLFTTVSRLTASPGSRPAVSSGPAIPQDGLAGATLDLVATTKAYFWLPTIIMPALALLLAITAQTSSRHATTNRPIHPRWRLLLSVSTVFLAVLLWFIPSALWHSLGYPAEDPWKYQLTPGVVFVAIAATATIKRHWRRGRIIDPSGHDRTSLTRESSPLALTTASGTLVLLLFPLLSLNWHF